MKNSEVKESFSISKRIHSFVFAFNGIAYVFRFQHNAWIHLTAAIIAISAGIWKGISTSEWIAITVVSGMVISMEIINTAIEKLVDIVHPEFSQKAGQIKDIAAGAVLVSAIAAFITGIVIFLPYFIN